MKKVLNTNLEIYNYLNLVDKRLGTLYKYTGYNSLPNDFDINKEKFEEILTIAQFRNFSKQPDFLVEGKRQFKKKIKQSLKNCRNIIKHEQFKKTCSKDFADFLGIYFDMREEITIQILKERRSHNFDEAAAWQEIVNLNPILGEMTDCLFDDKVNFEELFKDIEKRYKKSYAEKVATLEAKETKKEKEKQEKIELNLKNLKNTNLTKMARIQEKTAQNSKKTAKKREIKQIRTDIKKTNKESNLKKRSDKQM